MTTVARGANGLWGWSRDQWDPVKRLVANPPGGYAELGPFAGKYLIRETAWFALDALAHGEPEMAEAALDSVLSRQYDRPGQPWHGTFPIFDHDPEPGDDAIMWLSYDPNWRQFIGVTLALVVEEYGDALPGALVERCEAAVLRAVEGEPAGRIPPWYSNPALMHAWLADWAGRRRDRPDLCATGRALAEQVAALFDRNGTLPEFNSPTYDGVNLFAAVLWAGAGEPLRAPGRRLAEGLLDSLGFLYHPGLRNLCGPYTRTYGMDLSSRITLYGLWRLIARDDPGALPALGGPVEHSHDLFFSPLVRWAGRRLPRPFHADNGIFPRRREFVLGRGRQAVAQLVVDGMLGAERGGRDRLLWDQYVPGSVHWAAGESCHWLRVHAGAGAPVDCSLEGTTLVAAPAGPGGTVRLTTNGPVEARGAGLAVGRRVVVEGPRPELRATTGDAMTITVGGPATITLT